MDTPFDALPVDPDADDEDIEQAYRERVKDAHPDQGGSVDEFQRVRAAYEALHSAFEDDPDATGGDTDSDPDVRTATTTRHEQQGTHVEYLDYEVLHDHGWTVRDDDLFERAAEADLDPLYYGTFRVRPQESLLEAAERNDFAWPYACRGGACANCAVYLVEGELSTPVNTVLPPEMAEEGIRLSCNGIPVTPELKVVFNVKHMPALDDLLLPPRPWKEAHLDD